MQRLTGDFITSSDIGHLKKLGTVMYKSSLTIFCLGSEKIRQESGEKLKGLAKRKIRQWGEESVERVGLKKREKWVKGTLTSSILFLIHLISLFFILL